MLKVAEAEENLKVEYWHYRQKQVIKAKRKKPYAWWDNLNPRAYGKKEGYTFEQAIDFIKRIAKKKTDDNDQKEKTS